VIATALGAAAFPAAAGAQTQVAAAGNPFAGNMKFDPAAVAVGVGDVVRWTNTDVLVPHTATEDHGLWNLTGTYGQTPANPPGFGPGDSRERPFEAGTHKYFCEVHPEEMRGTVSVPVRLEAASTVVERKPSGKRRKRRRIRVTWAPAPPGENLGLDVEIRRGDGPWRRWRDGTQAATGTFRTQTDRAPWTVRARLRRLTEADEATDWSPEVTFNG
jgi:plastocyanin